MLWYQLVAGSGNAQSGDGTNAAQEVVKDDGVGVPGPLTRLFVVANKGVAALIQDLILVCINNMYSMLIHSQIPN